MARTLNSRIAFLRISKRTLLLITIVVAATIALSTTLSVLLGKMANLDVPSLGTIKAIGVEAYWDMNLQNKTEAINWGTVSPGLSQNVTLYIKSVSNIETTLHLSTANWSPANISDYMDLTWNYNRTAIRPSEIVQATLTLSASSSHIFVLFVIANDVKQFSFDIIITASE